MRNLIKIFSILFCIILSAPSVLAAPPQYLTYTVKRGESLSEILSWLGICPLWGKKNKIAQTYELNTGIIKKRGNLIPSTKKINLPVTQLLENDEYEISNDNEVFFKHPSPILKCGTNYIASKKNQIKIREIAQEVFLDKPHKDEVVQEPILENSFGVLRASSESFFSSMDVTDTNSKDKAEVLSRLNSAYQLAWEQQWDNKNKTFIFLRNEKINYEAIEERLPSKSYNLQGFGIGYEREVTSRIKLRSTFRTQERLFLRATSVSSLKMDRAAISEISLAPIYHLYTKGQFDLHGDLGLSYLMASKTSNYSIKAGQRYSLGLSITQRIRDFEISGRSFYSLESQDSSIMTKTSKDIGLSLGVSWSFGK